LERYRTLARKSAKDAADATPKIVAFTLGWVYATQDFKGLQ
jgi:hypothetical protein